MNIISQFNQFLEKNFNFYLKNYFNDFYYDNKSSSFSNYFNFINDLDSISDSFIKDIIKGYFEYIDTVNYIYNTYDTDYLKEIIFIGDCATWIKNFPKSHWFNFNPETTVQFAMDGFHFSQALRQLTTNKHNDFFLIIVIHYIHPYN